MAFRMIVSRFEKSHCLLKSSVPLPCQPNLIKTLPTGVISKLMIQTREPIPTYTPLNPVSLLWTMYLTKFDICRNVGIKLISFSAKTFKKMIHTVCKNFGEFIVQSYDPSPPPPSISSPLLCMLKHHLAPRNKITSGNISNRRKTLLHLNVKTIFQVSSTPD